MICGAAGLTGGLADAMKVVKKQSSKFWISTSVARSLVSTSDLQVQGVPIQCKFRKFVVGIEVEVNISRRPT